jgi:hypothetical protein
MSNNEPLNARLNWYCWLGGSIESDAAYVVVVVESVTLLLFRHRYGAASITDVGISSVFTKL